MAEIEGIQAYKNTVSKDCRKRPQQDWVNQVTNGVENMLKNLDKTWEKDSDVKFHIVVCVDYER